MVITVFAVSGTKLEWPSEGGVQAVSHCLLHNLFPVHTKQCRGIVNNRKIVINREIFQTQIIMWHGACQTLYRKEK
jgi:hypothetical protein